MGRNPCCSKEGMNRGAWTAQEDQILRDYIKAHGEGRWRNLPKKAGLKRCGKSCRLRWLNYLRPDIKRGNISPDEEELIIRLHKLLGNRWSLIAGRLPGRTDNEIKNYWNTNLCKKVENHQKGFPAHRKISSQTSEKNLTNPVTKTSIDTNPQSSTQLEIEENKAFKTKAIKPMANVSNNLPHTQNSRQPIESGLVTGSRTENDENDPLIDTYIPFTSHQPRGVSSVTNEENFDSDDFIMDFNIGELCLSDLLNSDDLLSGIHGLSHSNTTTSTSDMSPSSHYLKPAIFCEEMSQEGWTLGECGDKVNLKLDLQPLSPFFHYNGDDSEWLGY